MSFIKELETLLNRHSLENQSNTPDFILAKYLKGCLDVYVSAIQERDSWYKFIPFEKALKVNKEKIFVISSILKDKEVFAEKHEVHPENVFLISKTEQASCIERGSTLYLGRDGYLILDDDFIFTISARDFTVVNDKGENVTIKIQDTRHD